MIDFIKLNRLAIGLDIKDLLEFPVLVYPETGVVLPKKRTAKLGNLVFTIIPSDSPFVTVQGSMHKFANGGLHNYDQFTLSRFREVAEELAPYISMDDQINVLECGVNMVTLFDPSVFLDNLIAFKGYPIYKNKHNGQHYAEVSVGQYRLKIYNKGLQYNQGNILRFEYHWYKMQQLAPNGLVWGDLQNPQRWKCLMAKLIKAFGELVFYDPTINLNEISSLRDKEILIQGNNPIFWQDLIGVHKSRKVDQFQEAVRKYGQLFNSLPDQIAAQTSSLIDVGYSEELVNSYHVQSTTGNENVVNSYHVQSTPEDPKVVNSYQNDDPENGASFSGTSENVVNSSTILSGKDSPQGTPQIPLSISTDSPKLDTFEDRVCCVTGISISNQRKDSIFLNANGIRRLLKSDPERFNSLKRQRLSNRWEYATLDIQIRELAHSIRNEFYNPKHNAKRDVGRIYKDWLLYDHQPWIKPEKWNLYNQ